ncbi:peptidylprolyl isomerase [Xanthobacter sp. VNH20]|uniref:peptidylprolyl isomerase n=1 Tax=Xanthobacter sp. VNH20 TaxID=3156616 RepID=UPI0032B58F02
MQSCRRFLFLFSLAVAALSSGVASAQQILAMVNGAPITSFDVAQRQRMHTLLERKNVSAKEALEEVIDDRIKISQGVKLGIDLEQKEIDDLFANVAARSGRTADQLADGLKQGGIEPNAFKQKLRADNIWQQYVRARSPSVTVRDQDVLAAINHSGNASMVATEYTLTPIVLVVPRGSNAYAARLAEANSLRTRFNGCESGLAMAKAMKETVVRSPVLRLSSEMPAALRQLLDKTEVGRLAPAEVTQSGVEVFAVCAKREVHGEAANKRDVKDQLATAQFQAESKRLLTELRKSSLIVYR